MHRGRISCTSPLNIANSLFLASAQANAQVNVVANATNIKASAPDIGIGLHTSVSASQFGNSAVPWQIAESGVELLRYRGGSYSDIYRWPNHTADGGYAANQSHFGRFGQIIDQSASQAMITVHDGSALEPEGDHALRALARLRWNSAARSLSDLFTLTLFIRA